MKLEEYRKIKKSKYRNVKCVLDGETFDSKKEMRRFIELRLLEKGRYISNLQRQVQFPIVVDGHAICAYVADFVYLDKEGRRIVEDVKSPATRKLPVYRLKKKLLKACRGLEILET